MLSEQLADTTTSVKLSLLTGDLEESKHQLMKAIDLALNTRNWTLFVRPNLNIAEYFYSVNDLTTAKEYARKGEELAKKLRADKEFGFAKKLLAKIDAPQG
jgi:hypothetical protein